MVCQAGVHFFSVRVPERDTTLFGWSNLFPESYYRHLKVVPKRPRQTAPPTPRLAKA